MGDLGGMGRPQAGIKPRPLGKVKTETLHFQTTAAAVAAVAATATAVASSTGTLIGGERVVPRPAPFLPVPASPTVSASAAVGAYPELRRGPGCEDQSVLRASIKSMREIRENLRQAALLNIVAAANSEGGPPSYHNHHFQHQHHHHHHHHHPSEGPTHPSHPSAAPELRLHFLGTSPSQLPPPHHHYHHYHQQQQHHHHQRNPNSPLTLHMTTNGTSPFQQQQSTEGAAVAAAGGGGGGGRSAGSGTYHSVKKDGDTSPLPHNLVANLLSPRMRTISIPRPGPRVTDLSGPFIHKSLTQAKECLSRVGEMVRSRTEGAMLTEGGKAAVTNEVVPYAGQTAVSDSAEEAPPAPAAPAPQRPVVPSLIQVLDSSGSPVNADQLRSSSASPTKAGSVNSYETSTTSTVLPPHSASSGQTLTEARSASSRKASARSKDDRRGSGSGSAHRALSVRRHLSPGKKRELVKRLTEMAKCEAVDMSNPMGVPENRDNRFRPPMIILSQQRQEIRCPEELNADVTSARFSGVTPAEGGDLSNGMHRAKSLSSLNHALSYPATTRDTVSSELETHSTERPGRLHRAASGSMPDLVMEGGPPCSAYNQRDMKKSDSSDWATTTTTSQTFAEGIVGKTLLKEKEVGNTRGLVESRPLLPATPKYRSRRSTRPSSRRSTLGLRDRGPPPDTPTGANATTTTTTTVFSLNPNRLKSNHGAPPPPSAEPAQPPAPSTHNLPVLTITGLNRERPPPGTPSANSRAARELRPTSRAEVTGSLQLYQHLDDQCEKLQRQLNITLNMPPRRGPHWQSGTIPPSPIPIHRNGFSTPHHHPSLFLTDGHDHDDADATTPTTAIHFRHHNATLRLDPHTGPLSDVDEQSQAATTTRTDSNHPTGEESGLFHNGYADRGGHSHHSYSEASARLMRGDRKAGSSGVASEGTDPVLQSKKEPRYQGFSSRVPESEVRSQFHYVTPGSVAESEAAAAEQEREMKYRVLKALDQDVYYDFQHRKYRNTPGSTPLVRCNNEEDRPRVHFYKVKLNGET